MIGAQVKKKLNIFDTSHFSWEVPTISGQCITSRIEAVSSINSERCIEGLDRWVENIISALESKSYFAGV